MESLYVIGGGGEHRQRLVSYGYSIADSAAGADATLAILDHGAADDLRRCLDAGADAYVHASFAAAEVAAALAARTGTDPVRDAPASEAGAFRSRVLLIEDDAFMRDMVRAIVERMGHEVLEAPTAADGLSLALANTPQLVVLDRVLPDRDGLEVLRELRRNISTQNVQVLLVSARSAPEERVVGLRAGADDYVAKPFSSAELAARIEAGLRRSQRDLAADPLTKLPGNACLRRELDQRLDGERGVAVVYADLNEFKAYVDHYGFEHASDVILRTGQLLYNTLIESGDPEDFVGHIGGDDFLFLVAPERAEELCRTVLDGFARLAPGFYADSDRERGYIDGHDRYGVERRFPLLSLSLAIIDVAAASGVSLGRVGAFAAGCKREVKSQGGNAFARFRYEA